MKAVIEEKVKDMDMKYIKIRINN